MVEVFNTTQFKLTAEQHAEAEKQAAQPKGRKCTFNTDTFSTNVKKTTIQSRAPSLVL